MKLLRFIKLTSALLFLLVAANSWANPTGVYTISNVDNLNNVSTDLGQTYMSGALIRQSWAAMETCDPSVSGSGCYSFTNMHSAFGLLGAGQKIEILVTAGQNTPCWLVNEGPTMYQSYSTMLTNCTNNPTEPVSTADASNLGSEPVPWDTTYETKFGQFITALAADLTSNGYMPNVSGISVEGINALSGEIGVANGHNDATGWAAVGFSQANIQSAYNVFLADWATAFPRADIAIQSRWTFNGFPTPPATCTSGSSYYPRILTQASFRIYPARTMMMFNTASDTSPVGGIQIQMCPIGLTSGTTPQIFSDCVTSMSCVTNYDFLGWDANSGGKTYYMWEGLQELNSQGANVASMWAFIQAATTHMLLMEGYHADFTAGNAATWTSINNTLKAASQWNNAGLYSPTSW